MVSFTSLYRHGFVRAAIAAPQTVPADPAANAAEALRLAKQAHDDHAALILFPELGLSGYAIDDLLLQQPLLDSVLVALQSIVDASVDLFPTLVVGAPLAMDGAIYNCGVAIHRGAILGVAPKSFLPNYREYYEKRHFAAAFQATRREISLLGKPTPFGADLVFEATDLPGYALGVEICEDIWSPDPPSTLLALAGATVLANLSASNITIGKAEDRAILCDAQSRRCVAAYLYSAAGAGESTTDLAWDGQLVAFEAGEKLGESERFQPGSVMIAVDIDVERLNADRARFGTFRDGGGVRHEQIRAVRRIPFTLHPPAEAVPLRRQVSRFPFVPNDPARLDRDCYEAYNIQVAGLLTRLKSTGLRKLVIGVSGGLDSTQALLVACRVTDLLGLPRSHVIARTLPGFATGEASRGSAWRLMRALGVDSGEVDIKPLSMQILKDIGHPFAAGEKLYDVTFENVQAGARTDFLFRLANKEGALVVGTGDLSELALGWCTYGVGDQMSHYAVNASTPKTLIQHLIRWVAAENIFGAEASDVLRAVLASEITPELIPAASPGEVQRTEDTVGPYALQDFNLHYVARYGFRPSKIAFLAQHAWGDSGRGAWPANVAESDRRAYALPEIKKWLAVFLRRFFTQSQFKRSAIPNGPKISSAGALSPRGDWRAPSDSSAQPWLDELARNTP